MQTDPTTPNIVEPTMLEVVSSVLAVMCKRMHQLPTMLARRWLIGLSDEVIALLSPRRPCAMRVRGPINVGRAVLTDPSLLCYVRRSVEQKKCWKLLSQKFDRFKTLSNNSQQHTKTCNIQQCYITGNFFPNSVRSHWLLRGHMTSNNKTVPRQNL